MTYNLQLNELMHSNESGFRVSWQKRRAPFGEFSCPVLQRVQINLTFSNNVRILCISWNVKTSQQLTNCLKESRNKRSFNRFSWCTQLSNCPKMQKQASFSSFFIMRSTLILLPFLTVAQHESGTRRTISLSVTVNKKISNQCNLTAQIEWMSEWLLLNANSANF